VKATRISLTFLSFSFCVGMLLSVRIDQRGRGHVLGSEKRPKVADALPISTLVGDQKPTRLTVSEDPGKPSRIKVLAVDAKPSMTSLFTPPIHSQHLVLIFVSLGGKGRCDSMLPSKSSGSEGMVWWTEGAPDLNRFLAKTTPYADGFSKLAGE
jgi:hypothetical protein